MGRSRGNADATPEAKLSDSGIARIVRSAFTDGYELVVDGTPQSHVNLDNPKHLHFEYIARMGAVIDLLGTPGRALTALHLGGGAMTIPRYIAKTRPDSRQQVIEREEALVHFVREHLPLPRGAQIRVRIGDAREVARKLPPGMQGACDLIVSDIFAGARTPAHVTTVEFYQELAALLAPGGMLLVNITDGPALQFTRRHVATVKSVLPHAMVLADLQMLKGKHFGNVVLAASAQPIPAEWLPKLMAAGPHPAAVMHSAELERFILGAVWMTDGNPSASPRPDASLF